MTSRSRSYELFKQIHASPGMEYLNRRKRRAFSHNIFQGNYIELQKACAIVEDQEIGVKLMYQSNKELRLQAHMEVMRLFHNFLAAAKSLVDHTRVFVDQYYEGTSFKDAYTQKVQNEMAADPLIKFIQDLRNFMLHRGLPGGSMSLYVTNNPETGEQTFESTVSIDKERLLEWKKWTQGSQEFLSAANNKIKISELCNAYGERIEAFYEWFDNKLRHHHKHDIEAFEQLQKKYQHAEEEERAHPET